MPGLYRLEPMPKPAMPGLEPGRDVARVDAADGEERRALWQDRGDRPDAGGTEHVGGEEFQRVGAGGERAEGFGRGEDAGIGIEPRRLASRG